MCFLDGFLLLLQVKIMMRYVQSTIIRDNDSLCKRMQHFTKIGYMVNLFGEGKSLNILS